MGGYARRSKVESVSHEELSGVRHDMELWDIDFDDDHEAKEEFRNRLIKELRRGPSALMPYRPSRFLSSVAFVCADPTLPPGLDRAQRCWNLGPAAPLQAAFDDKPWVETSLAADEGVPIIPWRYVPDSARQVAKQMVRDAPVVLRPSRTSGGEGILPAYTEQDVDELWRESAEGFMSVAPKLDEAIPLNIGATVWDDGVTVHYPSFQLIGIDSCTSRYYGYCGNDFGAVKELDPTVVDLVEEYTRRAGRWLQRHGYRGTFGADYLVSNTPTLPSRNGGTTQVLFTEINPRFQGSTRTSAWLSTTSGEACLYLEHLAAMLRIAAPRQRPLRELVAEVEDRAHVVVHWMGADASRLNADQLIAKLLDFDEKVDADLVVDDQILVEPGATVLRATTSRRLTADGKKLADGYAQIVSGWQRSAAPTR